MIECLVGSEMCIRDRHKKKAPRAPKPFGSGRKQHHHVAAIAKACHSASHFLLLAPSYTHPALPFVVPIVGCDDAYVCACMCVLVHVRMYVRECICVRMCPPSILDATCDGIHSSSSWCLVCAYMWVRMRVCVWPPIFRIRSQSSWHLVYVFVCKCA